MTFTLNEHIEDLKIARADILYDLKQEYATKDMAVQLQLLIQAIGNLEAIYEMDYMQTFKSDE